MKARKDAIMDRYIEQVLFPVLFQQQTFADISTTNLYQRQSTDKVFLEALHNAVVKMHSSYSGSHAHILRTFFIESKLVDISLQKIRKGAWNERCRAIRDLSQMQIESSSDLILQHCSSSNETLRQEAIIGLIRMSGFGGLNALKVYTYDINQWMIINIIHHLNLQNQTDVPEFDFLLQSKNKTVILLGCRLIEYYKQTEQLNTLVRLNQSTDNIDVQEITAEVIDKLNSF
ncbi:MAG: hypothetical protein V4561_12560 [Bacteroidota bacterium]